MIPQNELRIGNRVLIDGVSNNVDLHDMKYYDQLYPIPITEDWLIRLGFETNGLGYSPKDDCTICVEKWSDGDWYCSIGEGYEREIYHIHQLQNLYFALTGKELELKQNA